MITITKLNKILQNPEQLQAISYQTIQQLLEQYPYCASLRMLLAKKQKEEQSPVYQSSLVLASIYANDRGKLYEFLNAKVLSSNPTQKEKTETNPVEEEEQKKKDRIVKLVAPPPVFYQQVSVNPPVISIEKEPTTTPEEKEGIKESASMEVEGLEIEDWLRSMEPARMEENEQLATVKKNFKLPRIPVFEADLLNFLDEEEQEQAVKKSKKKKKGKKVAKKEKEKSLPQTPKEDEAVLKEAVPTEKKAPKEDNFSLFLSQTKGFLESLQSKDMREEPTASTEWEDDSTAEKEEVISETLADLLALQGQKVKAIKMYEALSLKFPKKNRLFADKIAQLK